MSDDLILTDEERRQILEQRAQRQHRKWIVQGLFMAADWLNQWGRESFGGDGEKTNPATGKPWGEVFFSHADMITKQAAYLSANLDKINV